MLANLGGRVDAVFFCPHTAADGCDCRKPKPGLFEQIGERFGIELRTVPAVGDSKRAIDEYYSEIFCGGRSTINIFNECEVRGGGDTLWTDG